MSNSQSQSEQPRATLAYLTREVAKARAKGFDLVRFVKGSAEKQDENVHEINDPLRPGYMYVFGRPELRDTWDAPDGRGGKRRSSRKTKKATRRKRASRKSRK
jgi:hypothetical protein